MEFVSLGSALNTMRQVDRNGNPVPFDILFCTCDQKRKTGGKLKRLKDAYLSGTEVRRTNGSGANGKGGKKPNHFGNATRNIKDVSGDLTKVHIHLILELNGNTVL